MGDEAEFVVALVSGGEGFFCSFSLLLLFLDWDEAAGISERASKRGVLAGFSLSEGMTFWVRKAVWTRARNEMRVRHLE